MAYLLLNYGEQCFTDTLFNGTPANALGSATYVALGSTTGGIGSTKSVNNGTNQTTTLAEIGQTTAAGYARSAVNRSGTAPNWPNASLVSSSYQTTASQVTFTFTGAPTLNGATLWFMGRTSTIGAVDGLFGADLAATRTFANGDTEKVTVTYRMT